MQLSAKVSEPLNELLEGAVSDAPERVVNLPLRPDFWGTDTATQLLHDAAAGLAGAQRNCSTDAVLSDPERTLTDRIASVIEQHLQPLVPPPLPLDAAHAAWFDLNAHQSDSYASFCAPGPVALVERLEALRLRGDAAAVITKLTKSYELLELESAQPELFCRGIDCLAAGLLHESAEASAAYAAALQLVCDAMRTSEDALLDMLASVRALNAPDRQAVGGANSSLRRR